MYRKKIKTKSGFFFQGLKYPVTPKILQHENGKHLCDECGKEYSSHKLLYNHKMYCHIRVNCEICDKTVAKGLLKRHMDTVHAGKKMEQFLCAICPYTAHARRYLTEHIKKHHSTPS